MLNSNTVTQHQDILKKSVSFVVVATVFAYLSYQIFLKKNELSQIDWSNAWLPITVSLFLCIATQFFQVFQWYHLVKSKLTQPLPIKPLLATFFYPIPGKYLPGKILYAAARIEFLKQRFHINRSQGTALFTLEIIGILVAAALLSAPYALDLTYRIFVKMSSTLQLAIAISLAILILLSVSLCFVKKLRLLVLQHKLVVKILTSLRNMFTLPKQTLLMLVINYSLMWISFGGSGLIIVLSLAPEITQSITLPDYIMIASAFIAAWLIGFLSFLTPGGLGVREASLVLFLSPYIDIEQAAIAAIISRICWTLAEFSGVLTCALLKTPKPPVNC